MAVVNVDLKKVRDNARRVVSHLPGIDVVAVTKVTWGSLDVGATLLACETVRLADISLESSGRERCSMSFSPPTNGGRVIRILTGSRSDLHSLPPGEYRPDSIDIASGDPGAE